MGCMAVSQTTCCDDYSLKSGAPSHTTPARLAAPDLYELLRKLGRKTSLAARSGTLYPNTDHTRFASVQETRRRATATWADTMREAGCQRHA